MRVISLPVACMLAGSLTLQAQDGAIDSAYQAAQSGAWEASAMAWRRALDEAPNLAGAAVLTLRGASADGRSAIRRLLMAPPLTLGSRRALAGLEIDWGTPRVGWSALAPLPASDAVVAAWLAFASDAEDEGDPLTARDAFVAALQAHPSPTLAIRAAYAALAGDDAANALALTERPEVMRETDSSFIVQSVIPVRVRALSHLGRAGDADSLVKHYGAAFDSTQRTLLAREVAWGFVRTGDVGQARATIAQFGLSDDAEIQAWLALYEGNLRGAREAVRRVRNMSPGLVAASALLFRTTVDTASDIGHAFVQLARADTAAAADTFAAAGVSATLHDAAPLLLAMAARLHVAQHDDDRALPLWRNVVEQYPGAPEAPEADLEWGRALKRQSNVSEAIARWEHLILTYPGSALVPQARHELDLVKAQA